MHILHFKFEVACQLMVKWFLAAYDSQPNTFAGMQKGRNVWKNIHSNQLTGLLTKPLQIHESGS
jgi:hypothetical protein